MTDSQGLERIAVSKVNEIKQNAPEGTREKIKYFLNMATKHEANCDEFWLEAIKILAIHREKYEEPLNVIARMVTRNQEARGEYTKALEISRLVRDEELIKLYEAMSEYAKRFSSGECVTVTDLWNKYGGM